MEAGFSGQLLLAGVVVMEVGILVLDGRVVANGAVVTIRVEPAHPAAGGELKVIDGVEWSVVVAREFGKQLGPRRPGLNADECMQHWARTP